MKPSQYQELEKNKEFKKYYLNKTLWWIDYLFVPPALLLFIGLAGILHMSYNDRLWSFFSLPYILVFFLGAVWLKSIKRNVQNKILAEDDKYLVCAGRVLFDAEGRYFFIFSKDSKRYNETLINKLGETLSEESFDREMIQKAKTEAVEIPLPEEDTPIYLKAIHVNKVLRANRQNVRTGVTPLLYISPKEVFVVRSKDLKKFSS